MTRQHIIEKTLHAIDQLPDDKAMEICEFADFILKRYEEQTLSKGIHRLASEGRTFDFLAGEEELYTLEDLKVVYSG